MGFPVQVIRVHIHAYRWFCVLCKLEGPVLTSEDARARIMSRTPMRRLGQPSEVADTVAWLASDAASYVTGEIVVVDGGRMTLNYTV